MYEYTVLRMPLANDDYDGEEPADRIGLYVLLGAGAGLLAFFGWLLTL